MSVVRTANATRERRTMRLPRLRPLHQLQWRLTFNYAVTTVVSFLVLEAVVLWLIWFALFRSPLVPTIVSATFAGVSTQFASALEQTPPDLSSIDRWLDWSMRQRVFDKTAAEHTLGIEPSTISLLAVVDREGRVLAVRPTSAIATGESLTRHYSASVAEVTRQALTATADSEPIGLRDEQGYAVAATPIIGSDGQPVGAIVVELPMTESGSDLIAFMLAFLLPSALVATMFALMIGTIFGFLTARRLTRRLRALSVATDAWSDGDFSIRIHDHSGDEIAQLSQRLNYTAEQIQSLLQTREQLAALEERNRLARDLHDSVKQQIFAAAMQVGAARALLDTNSSATRACLEDAERLARQAQHELTGLIRELRPAALDGRGLGAALRDYIADWSRQNSIVAEVRVQGERTLPLSMEQALFRVCQEALANVARHSSATNVGIHLALEHDRLDLRICDNGKGFDSDAARTKGVGLRSMHERAAALGGSCEVASTPGTGTTITLCCPLVNELTAATLERTHV